ncbi:MAG TPA: hypothetical protein VJN18_26955 [Polyangiaceae bacterium]|nr:hypothetical protein [Polyangiaceae bacterium]
MQRLLGFLGRAGLATVILVQHPAASWAAETTGQGVAGSLYAGGGSLEEPNNEGASAIYDERRAGTGVVGVLRFGRDRERERRAKPPMDEALSDQVTEDEEETGRDGVSERGVFVMLGVTLELEALRRTQCGYICNGEESPDQNFTTEAHFGGRVAIGYSFSLVEFRGGVLGTMPDGRMMESIVMPEGLVRIGPRSIGWFELGLGAYDASTTLRPGAFVGGAYGTTRHLRVSGHFGLHLPNGMCCSSVPRFGFRYELAFERALTDAVEIGLAGAAWNADLLEAAARISFLL